MAKTCNLLFICTGNSARSIIAEALMNTAGQGRFKAHSAGSRPTGAVHPMAIQELQALRVPTDGLRSKSWQEFAQAGAPEMDFVITVCDQAAGEICPIWPGQPISAHWGMPDPVAVGGSKQDRLKAFREVAIMMKRRLDLMMSLPLASPGPVINYSKPALVVFRDGMQGAKPKARLDALPGFATPQTARKITSPAGWGEIGRFAHQMACMGVQPMRRHLGGQLIPIAPQRGPGVIGDRP